jgi:hypothetical protein
MSHSSYCVHHIRMYKWAIGAAPRKVDPIIDYADLSARMSHPIEERPSKPPVGPPETRLAIHARTQISRVLILAETAAAQAGAHVDWSQEELIAASGEVPLDWRLAWMTCTSATSELGKNSYRWRAQATGPNGERVDGEGRGPIAALNALGRELGALRGSVSG